MELSAALLAIALAWAPPWYAPGKAPETRLAYETRLALITSTIAIEAPDPELALATLIKIYGESRFALEVHQGKRNTGGARCLGQPERQRGESREAFEALAGTSSEATRRCVSRVATTLARHLRWCGSWRGAFSAYATGKGCTAIPLGIKRARRLDVWLWRLRKMLAA